MVVLQTDIYDLRILMRYGRIKIFQSNNKKISFTVSFWHRSMYITTKTWSYWLFFFISADLPRVRNQRLKQSLRRSSMDLFLLAILSLISLHSQVLSLPLFLYLHVYTFIFPRMNLLNQFTHSFRLDLKLENWNLITIFTSIQVAYGDPSVVFLDSPTRNYLRQPSAEVDINFFVEIFIWMMY